MRLALAFLLVLVACASEDPGEPPPPSDWPGILTWRWSFEGGGACPPGVTRTDMVLASYDTEEGFPLRRAPERVMSVACSAGAALQKLANPRGVKNLGRDTWVELFTTDGKSFARSASVNTRDEDPVPHAVIDVARGWLHVQWTLRGETGPLTCADVGPMITVELYERTPSDIVLQPSLVACTAGELWLALPAGTYDLTLGAFAASTFYVGDVTNPQLLGKVALGPTTVAAGETTELGTQTLVLDRSAARASSSSRRGDRRRRSAP